MQDSIKLLPDYLVTTESILETDDLFILVQKLGIAILIGALIGLEREHSRPKNEKIFAGIRTFPLISVLGFIAALISSYTSFWVFIAVFIGYASLITTSHVFSAKEGRMGGTSEIAAFLTFFLGALVFWNLIILSAITGVLVALFLSLKIQLHQFVGKVSEEDLYATIKLAIITVIILPLLPDETMGPLDVLNPRLIWYMVIFISGISFIGYILIKLIGKDKGISVTGLMGGMVSSTAVAFSLSRKSKKNKELAPHLGVGIILASTVMFPRIFIIILVLNRSLISEIWLPLLIFTLAGFIVSYIFLKSINKDQKGELELRNPFELKSALLFGFIFGIVLFVSKAAEVYLGTGGVYAASALAGISTVDAIILSLARLAAGNLDSEVAITAIFLASLTNTITKGIIVYLTGDKEIHKITLAGLGIIGIVILVYLGIIILT